MGTSGIASLENDLIPMQCDKYIQVRISLQTEDQKKKNETYSNFSETKVYNTKGQIISEQNCGVLNFSKKQRNYCQDFCPSL